MTYAVRVLPNRYADSVRLMAIARSLRERDGVSGCELAMGTTANLEALARLGVDADAGPTDVVIAVDGPDANALLDDAEAALAAPPAAHEARAAARPRTIAGGAAALDGANVALVSVAGEYATLEAHHALSAGMHVFLFSDHVSEADERELKERARALGLLVMGPGCGTAMLGGVGLGFANVVRRGPVGIVAAAGTGAQEAACLLDAAGVGVSQIIGVGGRDLSAAIGGLSFRSGIELLADDDETETLLLVSKPPAPEVVAELATALPRDKRVVAAFVGYDRDDAPFEIHPTIEAGAFAAAGSIAVDRTALQPAVTAGSGSLLGLYSGGSLAHEAVTILEPLLGPLAGNVGHGDDSARHRILDLGEEEYTQGRPHPMVDLTVRLDLIEQAARRDDLGCLLLDVVLGYGAHADPAAELAASLADLATRRTVIARVCGTEADPQVASRQRATLAAAGVVVTHSNAAAAALAAVAIGATA